MTEAMEPLVSTVDHVRGRLGRSSDPRSVLDMRSHADQIELLAHSAEPAGALSWLDEVAIVVEAR